MPRTRLKKSERFNAALDNKIKELKREMRANEITNKDISDLIGITPQAVGQRFKTKAISIKMVVAIQFLINEKEKQEKEYEQI